MATVAPSDQIAAELGFIPDADDGFGFIPDKDDGFGFIPDPQDSLVDQAKYVGGALVTGVKTALRNADVLAEASDGANVPTGRQKRRAFEQAMADPRRLETRFNPATGELDSSVAQSRYGPAAKLEEIRRSIESEREARQFDIARQTEDLAARPRSQTMREFDALPDNDPMALAGAIARNPVEIIATVVAESLPASLAGLPGGPAGVGAASASSEYANTLVGEAAKAGFDFSNPRDVARFFRSPDAFRKAHETAQTRAGVIGLADAMTAGLAGRFLEPALGMGARRVAVATGQELGMQMAGGAGGEAAGSLAAGQPVSLKDVALEAIGELGGTPAEITQNLSGELRRPAQGRPPASFVPRPLVEPEPGSDLQIPSDAPPASPTVSGTPAIVPSQAPVVSSQTPIVPQTGATVPSASAETPATPAPQSPAGWAWSATTPQGDMTAKGRWAVLEADDLKTSFDPGYNPDLQPRDRTREASANQIATLATGLDPARLGDAPTTDVGAPVIDAEQQVLSGNGRISAIRQVYSARPDIAAKYRDWLAKRLHTVGLGGVDLDAMQRPVLVRVADDFGGSTPIEFARSSNQSQTLGMAESEKAASDARLLDQHPEILSTFAPDESGNVLAASNRSFLNAFIAATGDQAELLGKQGYNSGPLTRRVKNAVMAAALGTRDAALLNQVLENSDTLGIRTPVNALLAASPRLVKLRGSAYDIGPTLSQAMRQIVAWKQSGQKLDDWIGQTEMFADPVRTSASDAVMRMLAESRSSAAILRNLQRYADASREAISDAQSGGLLGDAPATQDQVIAQTLGEAKDSPSLEERLAGLKVDTAGKLFDATIGIPIALWNAAVDLAILAVRGGKSVAAAIQAAIDYIKANHPGDFNEAKAKVRLEQALGDTRRFGNQVDASSDVSNAVRGLLQNRKYQRRANEPDAAFAARIIDGVGGPEQAIQVFRDRSNGLPQAVRGMLAQSIIKRLGELEQTAALSNPAESDRLAKLAAQFIDQDVFEETTSAGQFIQSFAAFARMTARGMLAFYRRTLDHVGESVQETLRPALERITDALNKVNRDGLVDLGKDKGAQQATGDAVNQAVKESPEVQEAVRVVVAGEIGQHPGVQQRVRDMVQKLFQRQARPVNHKGLWPQYAEAAAKALADVAKAPTTRRPRAMLDEFTRAVSGVLREQIRAQFPTPAPGAASTVAGPTAMQNLLTLLSNRDKSAEVWSETIRRLQAQFPNDPRVAALASQPAALFSRDLLRQVILEEMEASELGLRDLVAGHYRALGDGQPLVTRIVAATGLTGEEAKALARQADDVWRTEVFKVRNDLDNRVRSVRESETRLARAARSGQVDLSQVPDGELDAAIRQQLRRARTSIGAVLKEHYTNQEAAGRTLAEGFVRDARLTPEAAAKLAGQLQNRFKELLAARKRAYLERFKEGVPINRRRKLPIEQLLELSHLGLLTEPAAWEAVRERLGLPVYDPKVAAEVTRRANALQKIPEGFQRDEASIDLLNYVANQRGIRLSEIPLALWYANKLSGPVTHLVNAGSNAVQVASHLGLATTRSVAKGDPGAIPQLLGAVADGFVAGADEALNIIKTGKVTGTRSLKLEASQPLERLGTDAAWKRVIEKWKYVARLMAAADMLFYKPAEGMRQQLLARSIAQHEGLSDDTLNRRIREILGKTESAQTAAAAQTAGEGLTGLNARRRRREIASQALPDDVRENARQYALRVVFNNEPYGVLGTVARGLNSILREVPALRLIVPFVNVVANVSNEFLNYFPPVGGARALGSHFAGWKLNGQALDLGTESGRADLFDTYGKAAAGLGALALVGAAAAKGLDDDDPYFAIYGSGPSDSNRRNQLRETGWIPWSIKVGDRYVSFQETPAAIPLGVLGSLMDAHRWRKLEKADALGRVAIAATAFGKILVDRSFLKGISDLFATLSRETGSAKAGTMAARSIASTAEGFVVPNALRQVDRLFDPTVTDSSTAEGVLVSSIPWVRRAGRPALNALGDPIKASPLDRFTSKATHDPIWSTLASKGAWISKPQQGDLTSDQYYDMVKSRGQWLRAQLIPLLPQLKAAPPDQAQEIVERLNSMATRIAKARILQEAP